MNALTAHAGLESPIISPWGAPLTPEAHEGWRHGSREALVRVSALAGDMIVVASTLFAALSCPGSPAAQPGLPLMNRVVEVAIATLLLLGTMAYEECYSLPLLLERTRQLARITKVALGWTLLFLAASAALGHGPAELFPESAAAVAALAGLLFWRLLFSRALKTEAISARLRRRIILLGWTPEAGRFARQAWEDRVHPCEVIGYVEFMRPTISSETANLTCLGMYRNLPQILQEYHADIAVLADMGVGTDEIVRMSTICQREMVEFKFIPTCFPTLLSGMHVEWMAATPLIGVDRLHLNRLQVRLFKRLMDIAGALFGLLMASPLIAFFCLMVYAESPGPVFYKQERLGRLGRRFHMIKIRSMKPDAEVGGKVGWSVKDDPRRLRVGAFMRRWNIDELPQFWNVLTGDMSLVGPRPERPQLISDFKYKITNYNARHMVKPGLTGWAQVNGLRGDTDLTERVRHDLHYIENWSPVLDIRIMWMTLFKHKNAC
jgi:exopolysaccharide biosynthesis polyprenyl glycosylphosphotransferase